MPDFDLITRHEVLRIRIGPIGEAPEGSQYRIRVFREDAHLGQIDVSITDIALHSDATLAMGGLKGLLLRIARDRLWKQRYSDVLTVGLQDVKQLCQMRGSVLGRPKTMVASVLQRYFEYQPKGKITAGVIRDSTGIEDQALNRILGLLENSEILIPLVADGHEGRSYALVTGGFDRLERLLTMEGNRSGRVVTYFQEVTLPSKYDEPFVFVLMPFNEREFPQSVFDDILKPELEKVTGLNCLRADSAQNPNRVTNQIYSAIKSSEVIVADVSTLNPNVLIELGISLAEQKPTYVLCNETEKARVLPRLFDISDLAIRFYTDGDDLRSKLQEIHL